MATDAFTTLSSRRMGISASRRSRSPSRPGAAERIAGARRFDDNAMRAGTKAAGSAGWPREAIMSCGRKHPQSGPGLRSHGWFGAKAFVLIAETAVAAYVTAMLL